MDDAGRQAAIELSISDAFTPAGLAALGQVVMIDLMLAGDNVVVLGTLASGLAPRDRKRVLALGVAIALVFLIGFAWVATALLHVVGLLLAGGLLLLWVAWKLFREIRAGDLGAGEDATDATDGARPAKTFARAAVQVAIVDLSMSLDNVLAVAGAARAHPTVLFFGLALSVTLVALAANVIARIVRHHRWIAYFGLVVILYVAGSMIYQGAIDPEVGIGHLFG